ncbi:hypothetical protein HNQ51_003784 [Inhella inkyongensis]|uniref:Uncharacterized protein n=2 Tax=Inhella inkyongensis TaxID=392593 RepID=A0A840SA82_9BURK|nr:hypothetical protein [Inhella inkyongensis]MBB5206438.1 hypothetical protein [Inhella inkyongensis]
MLKEEAARRSEMCRDSFAPGPCPGATPAPLNPDPNAFGLHKWNNRWFKVPREYHSTIGMTFYWPSKNPSAKGPAKPLGTDWPIELYIRSYDIPPELRGYRAIEAAERDQRIIRRETVRPGLDRVEYFPLHPFTGERSSMPVTEYVATERRDPEGQLPIFRCKKNLSNPSQGGGGAGFMWRDGILVEVLIRGGNLCDDWPELFDEVTRVLNLIQKV